MRNTQRSSPRRDGEERGRQDVEHERRPQDPLRLGHVAPADAHRREHPRADGDPDGEPDHHEQSDLRHRDRPDGGIRDPAHPERVHQLSEAALRGNHRGRRRASGGGGWRVPQARFVRPWRSRSRASGCRAYRSSFLPASCGWLASCSPTHARAGSLSARSPHDLAPAVPSPTAPRCCSSTATVPPDPAQVTGSTNRCRALLLQVSGRAPSTACGPRHAAAPARGRPPRLTLHAR